MYSDSDEVWPRGLPQHCYVLAAPHGHPGGRHTPSSRIVGTYFPRATRRVKDVFRRWLRPSRLWGKTTSRQSFEVDDRIYSILNITKELLGLYIYIYIYIFALWELSFYWFFLFSSSSIYDGGINWVELLMEIKLYTVIMKTINK